MAARLAFIAILLAGIFSLRGGVIISQHSGAADPIAEGWEPAAVAGLAAMILLAATLHRRARGWRASR